jgi:hypothetical protein
MKNIAFCFYGKTRIPESINKFYKKIENDYDFFMSTWDDEDSRSLNFKFTKFNTYDFTKEKLVLIGSTPEQALDKHTNKLKNIKKNGKVVYMNFLINKVLSSVKEYEKDNNFKYDVIVFGRPDYIVNLDLFKREISKFATHNNIDRPIISTQSPITLNDDTFTIDNDLVFLLNNKALDGIMNIQRDLFLERKDLDIKYAYRGPHELLVFVIMYNNYISTVNNIIGQVIRPLSVRQDKSSAEAWKKVNG